MLKLRKDETHKGYYLDENDNLYVFRFGGRPIRVDDYREDKPKENVEAEVAYVDKEDVIDHRKIASEKENKKFIEEAKKEVNKKEKLMKQLSNENEYDVPYYDLENDKKHLETEINKTEQRIQTQEQSKIKPAINFDEDDRYERAKKSFKENEEYELYESIKPSNLPSDKYNDYNGLMLADQDNYGNYTFDNVEDMEKFAQVVVDDLNRIKLDDNSEYKYRIEDNMIQIYDASEVNYGYDNPDYDKLQNELQKQLGNAIYFEPQDAVAVNLAGIYGPETNDVPGLNEYEQARRNMMNQVEKDLSDKAYTMLTDMTAAREMTNDEISRKAELLKKLDEAGTLDFFNKEYDLSNNDTLEEYLNKYGDDYKGKDIYVLDSESGEVDYQYYTLEDLTEQDKKTPVIASNNNSVTIISDNWFDKQDEKEVYTVTVETEEGISKIETSSYDEAKTVADDQKGLGTVKIYDSYGEEIIEDQDKPVITLSGDYERDSEGNIITESSYNLFRKLYKNDKLSNEDYKNNNYSAMKDILISYKDRLYGASLNSLKEIARSLGVNWNLNNFSNNNSKDAQKLYSMLNSYLKREIKKIK